MLWMLALRAAPMRHALLLIDHAPGWLRHPLRMLRLLRERRALAAAQAAAADADARAAPAAPSAAHAASAARAAHAARTAAGSDRGARRHGTIRQRRAHRHSKLTQP